MITSIKVYNGEKIERGPLWYIISMTVIVFLIVYSFLKGGIMGGVSVLFIFLVIIAAYIILFLTSIKKTQINMYNGFFMIGDVKYIFDELYGFDIELDEKNGTFTNFVIIPKNTGYPLRYPIISVYDEVKIFYDKLIDNLPLYDGYKKDRMYKIIRALKLG